MMIPQQSRLDMLKAQALQMRMGNPMMTQGDPTYGGLQLSNQPVQSMLKPKYKSNMLDTMGSKGLYSSMIRGNSGGLA